MNRAHWPYFKPFFLYLPLGVAVVVWIGSQAAFSWRFGLLLFTLGALSWTVLEYAIHRGIFHPPTESARWGAFLSRSHLAHHQNPQDIGLVFVQFSTSLPLSGLWFLFLWAALQQWQGAALVLAGTWTGYLFYEFAHYSAHYRRGGTPLMRSLRKYHLLHHYQDDKTRFGVTSPLIDWLLGTYRPIATKWLSGPL